MLIDKKVTKEKLLNVCECVYERVIKVEIHELHLPFPDILMCCLTDLSAKFDSHRNYPLISGRNVIARGEFFAFLKFHLH